jgi:hypothetical protein
VVILQAALVAAEALGDLVGSRVESWVWLAGLRIALQKDVAADMHRNVGFKEVRLTREDHIGFNRATKILAYDGS